MTFDIDDLDSDDDSCFSSDVSFWRDWALEIELWNGRKISWGEASEFRNEAERRIFLPQSISALSPQPGNALTPQPSLQKPWITNVLETIGKGMIDPDLLLLENWTEFHKQNVDRPHAKYLQFCHSQGAIQMKNALMHAPKEIRDRVIVVAIAPAAVVSKELCYQSYNYASKKDIVPFGELAFAGALSTNEYSTSPVLEMAMEHHEELIILEPHPDATEMDHNFQL